MRLAGLIYLILLLAWPFVSTFWAYARTVRGAKMMFPDPYDPRYAQMASMAFKKAAIGLAVRGAASMFLLVNLVPVAREAERWHNTLFAWAR